MQMYLLYTYDDSTWLALGQIIWFCDKFIWTVDVSISSAMRNIGMAILLQGNWLSIDFYKDNITFSDIRL